MALEPGAEPAEQDARPRLEATPAEIARLVARLNADEWRTREKAMRDLIAVGRPALAALQGALSHPDAEVRWRAAYALSRVEDDFRAPQPDPARTLYASAAEARAQEDGADAARRLYGEVLAKFPGTRWAAAARERLAELETEDRQGERPEDEGRPPQELVAQLGSADWRQRQEASRRLAALGEVARPALEQAARSPDPEVAWRAEQLLQRIRPPEMVAPPELDLLFGPRGLELEPPPRRGGVRPPAAASHVDGLVASLGSTDPTEVALARATLLRIGAPAIDALVRGLEDCEEATSVEIVDLLRQLTGRRLGFDPQAWIAWWRDLRQHRRE
ncbi:MAG: HEAT repeat domain-containing protein [Candidatus Brocadiia bacterium]